MTVHPTNADWVEYCDRADDTDPDDIFDDRARPSSRAPGPAAESEPGGWPDPLARATRPTGTPGRMARTGTPGPALGASAGPNLADNDNAPAPRDRPGA